MNVLVTGGAGFIGSAFVRMLAGETDWRVINLDKLTYAGNLENLASVGEGPRYRFVHGDICDEPLVLAILEEEKPDAIVHFAAESHVDRSILSPEPVVQTNLRGTFTLLEAARRLHVPRFVHVSTDEVYGSLEPPREATEDYPMNPSSPYSASKAGSDLLARSYFVTYKLPVVITRASNNYGPYQFPEKLIPLMIANAFEDRPLPVYGDGLQVRDWLYVDDHCRGILAALRQGREGEIYNIGGNRSLPNLEVVRRVLALTGKPESLIQYVTDRPGHDRRYALSSEKIMQETAWQPLVDFESGLARTIDWYRANASWVAHVRSGEYRSYYERNYGGRAVAAKEPHS
jgi:dTDP-glucose 4,6-dehydratase